MFVAKLLTTPHVALDLVLTLIHVFINMKIALCHASCAPPPPLQHIHVYLLCHYASIFLIMLLVHEPSLLSLLPRFPSHWCALMSSSHFCYLHPPCLLSSLLQWWRPYQVGAVLIMLLLSRVGAILIVLLLFRISAIIVAQLPYPTWCLLVHPIVWHHHAHKCHALDVKTNLS